jgi:hypothetical protein
MIKRGRDNGILLRKTGHRIDFGEATVLTRSMGYMDRSVKEAMKYGCFQF